MFPCARKLGYVLRRTQKVSSRLPGWPQDWEARGADPQSAGFALQIGQVRYVDLTGEQHEVDLEDVDAAFLDPMGELSPGS